MTGLNHIIDQIRKNAQEAAEKSVSAAREKAQVIRQNAQLEADLRVKQMEEKTILECNVQKERAISRLELEKRTRILQEKQKLIAEMIDQALESLKNLPTSEYFSVLVKIAAKHAVSQPGIMMLSEKDLKRTPTDFLEKVNEVVPEGGKLVIAQTPGNIDNGFLLVYGDVEENCTFDALFEDMKEDLQDQVHKLLFAG